MIDRLREAGVAAIGYDVLFSEASPTDAAGDDALVAALRRSGRVVLPVAPTTAPDRRGIALLGPLAGFAESASGLGHVDVEVDVDAIARRVFLRAGVGSPNLPAFPVALRIARGQATPAVLPGRRAPVPETAGGSTWARDFEVLVPKGVKVGIWTVNGGASVDGVTSEVRASTVNGSVEATSAGGPVQASTVNGRVHATMGRLDGDQDLNFSSVNGSVVAEFTGDIDADIDLSTVNGRFQTDWPVTITGRIDPRHLRATLGKGGRRIKLSTVNGNVELRKR
jgi:hypothetical protein